MVDYLGSTNTPGAYGTANDDSDDAGASGEANPAYEYKIDAPTPALAKQTSKIGQGD